MSDGGDGVKDFADSFRLSRPGAGIRENGAPVVSRPRIQVHRRFDTPAPRVRDTGTPAPGAFRLIEER